MEINIRNTMASLTGEQKKWRWHDVQKSVENSGDQSRGNQDGRSRKKKKKKGRGAKVKREGEIKMKIKNKKEENNGSKESSKGVRNLRQEGRGSQVQRKGK